jgi:hypothetical protein
MSAETGPIVGIALDALGWTPASARGADASAAKQPGRHCCSGLRDWLPGGFAPP